MYKNNVISFKYCIILMFFYNEFCNNLVNVHLNEKIKFYRFKYFLSLKPILMLIKYIRIKYKVYFPTYENKLYIGTKLCLYSSFSIPLKYLNMSNNNYICSSLVLIDNLLYKYNVFYLFFISFLFESFKNKFFIELRKKKKFYKTINLKFYTFMNASFHNMFSELSNYNSFVNINFKSNSNNFFLNKLLLSHTFLNI